MKKALKYVVLFIAFSIIGFLIHKFFIELSISQIETSNNPMISRSLDALIFSRVKFAFAIGAIPLLYLITERLVKLKFVYEGLITCLLIFGTGILCWQLRILQINNRLRKMATFDIGEGINFELNYPDLNFETYLFVGFVIGTTASVLIFRTKNKTKTL